MPARRFALDARGLPHAASRVGVELQWLAFRAPCAGQFVEVSRDRLVTLHASTRFIDKPFPQAVLIAFYQQLTAPRAPGAAALGVVYIAGVNMVQAVIERDASGP